MKYIFTKDQDGRNVGAVNLEHVAWFIAADDSGNPGTRDLSAITTDGTVGRVANNVTDASVMAMLAWVDPDIIDLQPASPPPPPPPATATRVLLVGDSITASLTPSAMASGSQTIDRHAVGGAPAGFPANIPNVTIAPLGNHNAPAGQTGSLQSFLVGKAAYDAIVVNAGTNDMMRWPTTTRTDYYAPVVALIDQLRAHSPNATVYVVPPRYQWELGQSGPATRQTALVAAIGTTRPWAKILDAYAAFVSTDWQSDGVHLSAAGITKYHGNVVAGMGAVAPSSGAWADVLAGAMTGTHEATSEDFNPSWNFYSGPVVRPLSNLSFGTGLVAWGHVDQVTGSTQSPGRVHLKGLYIMALTNAGQWVQLGRYTSLAGATKLEGGVGRYEDNTFSTAAVSAHSSGIGIVADPSVPGKWHFWGAPRFAWNPGAYKGLVVAAKVAMDAASPNGEYVAGVGIDIWKTTSNGYTAPPNISNVDAGIGKMRRVTAGDRWVAVHAGTLSAAELAACPEPS